METAVPTLTAYLTEPLQIGEPDVAGPLAVFPLFGPEPRFEYRSFAQGRALGVTIKELEAGASVRDLVVANPTSLPVLLFEGEEVLGAQQNRTFDVSVLELSEGIFEVKSTSGDTYLGGEDFDQRIIDWLISEFRAETSIDLRSDRMALQRLKEAAERAKHELSSATSTDVNLPFLAADGTGPKHLHATLTRDGLEVVEPLTRRVLWTRRDMKERTHLYGDSRYLVLVETDSNRRPVAARVLRALEIFGAPVASYA